MIGDVIAVRREEIFPQMFIPDRWLGKFTRMTYEPVVFIEEPGIRKFLSAISFRAADVTEYHIFADQMIIHCGAHFNSVLCCQPNSHRILLSCQISLEKGQKVL
jgi:hypothetical protein